MFTALFALLKALLGLGLAGLLIIIGLISVATWLIKAIIVRLYYAIHHDRKKGGE